MVDNLDKLNSDPCSGHSALMGTGGQGLAGPRGGSCLFWFGNPEAGTGYKNFVGEGIALGRRPELVGGGLRTCPQPWRLVPGGIVVPERYDRQLRYPNIGWK